MNPTNDWKMRESATYFAIFLLATLASSCLGTVLAQTAPQITSTPATNATVGQPYTYDVDATGDPAPTYSLTTYPTGMTIDTASGMIEWTPTADQAGDNPITVEAKNDAGTVTQEFTITVSKTTVAAEISIVPDVLNLKSRGKFITAYIELPPGQNAEDIDAKTVKLQDVPAVTDPKYGFVTDPAGYLVDKDGDGIMERMVKFSRADVQDTAAGMIGKGNKKFHELTLTISGQLLDGTPFEGTDTIKIISKK